MNHDVPPAAALLLERAYRLALVLEAGCAPPPEDAAAEGAGFGRFVIAAELVAVLDEARAALLKR